MTDPIASASVLVVPDTTRFRKELEAELTTIIETLKLPPVPIHPVITKATTATQGLTSASEQAALASGGVILGNEQAAQSAQNLSRDTQKVQAALQAQAVAQRELTAIEEAGVLATTDLAISKAKLRQAEIAAGAAAEFEATAARTTSVELQAAAAAAVATADAQLLMARNTAIAEAALVREGKTAAVSAAQHEALGRGAFAASAGMLGVRGATLAASTPFLIGSVSAVILAKALQGASRDAEALAKIVRILGPELGNELAKNANTLSTQLGIADDDIVAFEGSVAQLFLSVGISNDKIADMSERLVQLAADLAAVQDVPVEQALTALKSGLAGNVRGLRTLNVFLNNTVVQQRALQETGKKSRDELTQQEIVLARLHLLYEQTANITGAAADRQEGLSQQTKILRSNIDDLGDTIGGLVLPLFEDLIKTVNFAFIGFHKLKGGISDAKDALGDFIPFGSRVKSILSDIVPIVTFGPVIGGLNLLRKVVQDGGNDADAANARWQKFFSTFDLGTAEVQNAADALDRANAAALRLQISQDTIAAAAAGENVLDVKIAGGGLSAQLAAAQKQLAADQKVLDDIEKKQNQQSKAVKDQRRKAKAQVAADVGAIESINSQIEAQSKAAASAAEQAANAAKQALAAADQDVIFNIQFNQTQFQIAELHAARTKTLRDDIDVQKKELLLVIQQQKIDALRIHDAKLRLQTLQQLSILQAQIENNILDLENQQKENERRKRQAARDRRKKKADDLVESLDLSAQAAALDENTDLQKKLLQKEINALIARRRLESRGSLEWKRLTLEIKRKRAEIKALMDEQKKANADAKALAFEFLQTQQGFAASLLGNVIPGLAAVGTVGGGGGTPNAPIPPIAVGGEAGAGLLKTKEARAVQDIGPTRGGQTTQTDLLRRILRELHSIRTANNHPDAKFQRSVAGSTMDIL